MLEGLPRATCQGYVVPVLVELMFLQEGRTVQTSPCGQVKKTKAGWGSKVMDRWPSE